MSVAKVRKIVGSKGVTAVYDANPDWPRWKCVVWTDWDCDGWSEVCFQKGKAFNKYFSEKGRKTHYKNFGNWKEPWLR